MPSRKATSAHLEKLSKVSLGANIWSFLEHLLPSLHALHFPHFKVTKKLSNKIINRFSKKAAMTKAIAIAARGDSPWIADDRSLVNAAENSCIVSGFLFIRISLICSMTRMGTGPLALPAHQGLADGLRPFLSRFVATPS